MTELRRLRRWRRMKLKALAHTAGTTPRKLAQIERGRALCPWLVAQRLCVALGAPLFIPDPCGMARAAEPAPGAPWPGKPFPHVGARNLGFLGHVCEETTAP